MPLTGCEHMCVVGGGALFTSVTAGGWDAVTISLLPGC